jgi:hypothetical protein
MDKQHGVKARCFWHAPLAAVVEKFCPSPAIYIHIKILRLYVVFQGARAISLLQRAKSYTQAQNHRQKKA